MLPPSMREGAAVPGHVRSTAPPQNGPIGEDARLRREVLSDEQVPEMALGVGGARAFGAADATTAVQAGRAHADAAVLNPV